MQEASQRLQAFDFVHLIEAFVLKYTLGFCKLEEYSFKYFVIEAVVVIIWLLADSKILAIMGHFVIIPLLQ